MYVICNVHGFARDSFLFILTKKLETYTFEGEIFDVATLKSSLHTPSSSRIWKML